jgi:hypothetical protein
MRIALTSSLAGLLLLFSHDANGQTETYRIACGSFDGVRAQFAANPISPPTERNRLVKKEDAISGLKLELTFSTADPQATITTSGNVNNPGVASFPATRVGGGEVISFIAIDPQDGSTNLLSIFPQQNRLIWTIHTNKIGFVDQIVLGKTFVGTCSLRKI